MYFLYFEARLLCRKRCWISSFFSPRRSRCPCSGNWNVTQECPQKIQFRGKLEIWKLLKLARSSNVRVGSSSPSSQQIDVRRQEHLSVVHLFAAQRKSWLFLLFTMRQQSKEANVPWIIPALLSEQWDKWWLWWHEAMPGPERDDFLLCILCLVQLILGVTALLPLGCPSPWNPTTKGTFSKYLLGISLK